MNQSFKTLDQVEKEHVLFVLEKLNGNKKKTAEMLNISERGLRIKLEKYGYFTKKPDSEKTIEEKRSEIRREYSWYKRGEI